MKKLSLFGIVVLGLLMMVGSAFGASDPKNLTINATVTATAKLSLSDASISFADADPDTILSIPSTPPSVTVDAKAKTSTGSTVTLKVVTGDDLKSGTDSIDITNASWTHTGAGFLDGAMSKTPPGTTVGSWAGSGNRSGTLTFHLANSWNYATGGYSATATYTLTAP